MAVAHRTPARKTSTATVTSADGASSDAPALTQDPLLLQTPDSCVPLAPAAGPMPTLTVSLPLSQSVVSAPGPAWAPVKSPAVDSAPQSSPPLPGSRTSTPTYDLFLIDIDITRGAAAAGPPTE